MQKLFGRKIFSGGIGGAVSRKRAEAFLEWARASAIPLSLESTEDAAESLAPFGRRP